MSQCVALGLPQYICESVYSVGITCICILVSPCNVVGIALRGIYRGAIHNPLLAIVIT